MTPAERVTHLERGHEEASGISPHYDDVFREVQQRISATGSAGKSDIAILTFWKRLRADTLWVRRVLEEPEDKVRDVTGRAVVAAREGEIIESARRARQLLTELPGFGHGPALASAVLTAAAPGRLAVYDKRARKGLRTVGLALEDPPAYPDYMMLVEQCRREAAELKGHQWSAREIDLALFMLGKPV